MKLHEFYKPDGSNWCQACAAKNVKGERVPVLSPEATCFCLVGALCRINGHNVRKLHEDFCAYDMASMTTTKLSIVEFNDTHNFVEVYNWLKEHDL